MPAGQKAHEYEQLKASTEQHLLKKKIDGLEDERERMANTLHNDVCNDLLVFERDITPCVQKEQAAAPEEAAALYRIVQTALDNSLKNSPSTQITFWLSAGEKSNAFTFDFRDNGMAINREKEAAAIRTVTERAESIGDADLQYAAALVCAEQLYRRAVLSADTVLQVSAQAEAAYINEQTNRPGKGCELYKAAAETALRGNALASAARYFRKAGDCLLALQQYGGALSLAAEAMRHAQQSGDCEQERRAYGLLASINGCMKKNTLPASPC